MITEPNSPDRTVCFCYGVCYGEILEAIRKGAHSLREIQDETQATMGCGGCECEVLEILERESKGASD